MSAKIHLIKSPHWHKYGWKRVKGSSVWSIVGYSGIYLVKDGKIYFVDFKQTIPLSRIDRRCKALAVTGVYTLLECDSTIEDIILKNSKRIVKISEEDQFLYMFLDILKVV